MPIGTVSANQSESSVLNLNNLNVVINEDGTKAVLERVSDHKIVVHEGKEATVVTKDDIGNVYVNGVLSGQVIFEPQMSSIARLRQATNYQWQYGGQRKYSIDFVDKTRGTAIAMLSLIPGWTVYAVTAATIADIWMSGKELWFIEDVQVTTDGVWKRSRTSTYSDSGYRNLIKTSDWSPAERIHW